MALERIESNEHSIRFKVLEEVSLVAVVEHILGNASAASPDIPAGRARALELLQLGAVYVGQPQRGLPDFIRWVRSLELTVPPTAAAVPPGHFVRVHPRPKRYPACHSTDWPRRVLYCDESYLAVNKPAGLPCMRHESNSAEELAACVGRALGLQGLEVCHRLDQWTTGVVVLSRTKEANKAFKRSLQDREAGLVKTYKALTYSAVPLGPQEHYMYDGPFNEDASVLGGGNLPPRGPRLLSRTAHERWRLCRLDVRECREHSGALDWYQRHFDGGLQDAAYGIAGVRHSIISGDDGHQDCQEAQAQAVHQREPLFGVGGCSGSRSGGDRPPSRPLTLEGGPRPSASSSPAVPRLYESTIDLHTGRTHQIRAQLASLGCPLVGDVMYGPLAGYLVDETGVVGEPELVALVEGLPSLDRQVGLHAWRLSWRGVTFTAPPEWGDE